MNNLFLNSDEKKIEESFLKNGYYVFPVEDRGMLDELRLKVFQFGKNLLESKIASKSLEDFFDYTHEFLTVDQLNDFRVSMIRMMADDPNLRHSLYHLAKRHLHTIVGNELAMQRAANLSIQLPNDDSSLLPLHTDVWHGNSPYEVVFWLPFVDCFKTKSMYILPREKSDVILSDFPRYSKLSREEMFHEISCDLIWPEVPYGHAVIFSHGTLHGNRVNEENKTRWTFNVRYKSLLSPYSTKALGETFWPITIKPVTRIGFEYPNVKIGEIPGGFASYKSDKT